MNAAGMRSRSMQGLFSLVMAGLVSGMPVTVPSGAWAGTAAKADDYPGHLVLLPGERIVLGTVETVEGGMVRINVGELEPRFIPIKGTLEKGEWSLRKGDRVELALSTENLVVDYHPVNHPGWHRIIRGRLAQPLVVGYEWAVIRTETGKEEAFAVRPLARLKMAAIPIDVPALFLVGEADKILDAEIGEDQVLSSRIQEWKRSVPKASDRRLEATLVAPPALTIGVRNKEGKEQHLEIRPFVEERLAKVTQGKSVILLLDDENKVTDVAVPPDSKP